MVVLPGADLARQDDEPLASLHAVDQVRQRLFMLFTSVKECRIGT